MDICTLWLVLILLRDPAEGPEASNGRLYSDDSETPVATNLNSEMN